MKRLSLAAVLAMLLVLCLLATAGPATAGTPKGAPSFTFYGGIVDELDPGQFTGVEGVGTSTHTHWRIWSWMKVAFPGQVDEQSWFPHYDWSIVLMDKADGTEGWHYHWGNGVISTAGPSSASPFWPDKSTWLWTTRFVGVTDPAGIHHITEYWTGCNKYKGLKAYCAWTMGGPPFQDVIGKGWILR
jgi:hypothetical protein